MIQSSWTRWPEWLRIYSLTQNPREARTQYDLEMKLIKNSKSRISDKWGRSAPHLQLIGMQIPPVWLTNPPTTAALPPYESYTLRHKYNHCPIQIHSLWCTNPLLWGTNPGNWIRLMKTPPHTNAPLQPSKSQFKTEEDIGNNLYAVGQWLRLVTLNTDTATVWSV